MTTNISNDGITEAMRLAAIYCADAGANGSCFSYHSAWPLMRHAGMVVEPALNGDSLARVLTEKPGASILISGTADYAMLECIQPVLLGSQAQVTVADICETPLRICQWYANRTGLSIAVRKDDILNTKLPERSFDAILTDSFFNQFPFSARGNVFRSWRRLLKPEGQVITITTLGYDWGRPRQIDMAALIIADAVTQRSESLMRKLGIPRPQVHYSVRTVIQTVAQTSNPFSVAFLAKTVEGADMKVIECKSTLPRSKELGSFVRLVASRCHS